MRRRWQTDAGTSRAFRDLETLEAVSVLGTGETLARPTADRARVLMITAFRPILIYGMLREGSRPQHLVGFFSARSRRVAKVFVGLFYEKDRNVIFGT